MKKAWIFVLLTAFSVVWFSGQPIRSQDKPINENKINKFNVFVNTSCLNEITKNKVESFIKRELRGLRDVDINNTNIPYTHGFYIYVTEDFFIGRTYFTFVFTILLNKSIEEFLSEGLIFDFFSTDNEIRKTRNEIRSMMKKLTDKKTKNGDRLVSIPEIDCNIFWGAKQVVYNPDQKNLSDICSDIVVEFDVKILEKTREQR